VPKPIEETHDLDQQLLDAHATNDASAMIALYTRAADLCEASGDIDAMCFYLTHAFVFALESGAPERDVLQERLWKHGREVRPDRLG
jgi:hypothetical protein